MDPIAPPPPPTGWGQPAPALKRRGHRTRNIAIGLGAVGILGLAAAMTAPNAAPAPAGSPVAAVGATSSPSPRPTPSPTLAWADRPHPSPATPEPTLEPEPTPDPTPATEETDPVFEEPEPKEYRVISDRAWARLVKNPDDLNRLFEGYDVWGCITQFDSATGEDSFRAQASNRREDYWYSDGDNVVFTGDASELEEFVAGDVFHAHVVNYGSLSYDTQIGGSTTVPMFSVVSISRKGSCE